MKYRAIIIEDEQAAITTLKSYINKYFPMLEVVGEYDSIATAEMVDFSKSDIVFLDVHLRDGRGVDLFTGKNTSLDKTRVVFTTAYEHYTKEAFRFKAFGYLLKPLNPNDFKEIMNRVVKDIKYADMGLNKVRIPTKRGYVFIEASSIVRCESESNYTRIYRNDGENYVISKTLKNVENDMLNYEFFIRVHQSHLVNIDYIDKEFIKANSLMLTNGVEIPISRLKKQSVLKALGI